MSLVKQFAVREFAEVFDGPHATPSVVSEGPIFLGIRNIMPDGSLDLSAPDCVSENDFERWTRRVTPQAGDVVFTYEATLHRYALIPEGFRGCLGRRTALVRVDRTKADPRYVYFYFRSPIWRKVVESNILSGATVDRIPLVKFPDFPVSLPTLADQQRIAEALDDFEQSLALMQKQIALLEKTARLIYTEWFVRLRPSRLTTALSNEWNSATLEEAVWINPKTPCDAGKKAPFVPMTALSQTGMVIEGIEKRAIGGGAKFQNGDTLLARITPCLENGKTGFVQFLDDENPVASGSTEFIVLRSRRVNPYWVYCLARTEHFREFAIRSMSGADGRQRVSTDSLAQYPITIPPTEILEDFEKAVGPMFEQIHTLTQQISQLRQARDLLLPRLISGHLRL